MVRLKLSSTSFPFRESRFEAFIAFGKLVGNAFLTEGELRPF